MFRSRLIPLTLLAAAATGGGCAGGAREAGREVVRVAGPGGRVSTDLARRETREATRALADDDADLAADRLGAALDADPGFGPARNNLGGLLYARGDYYGAAIEFQRAIELMPNRPEPLNNLGLTYEAAGRLDAAADAYEQALRLDPDDGRVAANLARVLVRLGETGPGLDALLGRVAGDPRPAWSGWARRQLAGRDAPARPPADDDAAFLR